MTTEAKKLIAEEVKVESLIKKEVALTALATAFVTCVVGANFAVREGVSSNIRFAVELVFLILAILICIWTTLSYFNLISPELHRIGLFLIFFYAFAALVFLIVVVCLHKL